MHADGVHAHLADCIEHRNVVRGLELDLDRNPARLLHRLCTPSDVHRALVVTVRGAGRQRHVHCTVQIARRYGDLSEVLWPFTGIVWPDCSVSSIPQNRHTSSVPQYMHVWMTVLATESRCNRAICQ